jgi:hypothetical protein
MTWIQLTYYFLISSNLFSNILLIYLNFYPIKNIPLEKNELIKCKKKDIPKDDGKIQLSLKNIEYEISKIKSQIQNLENSTSNINTNYF